MRWQAFPGGWSSCLIHLGLEWILLSLLLYQCPALLSNAAQGTLDEGDHKEEEELQELNITAILQRRGDVTSCTCNEDQTCN